MEDVRDRIDENYEQNGEVDTEAIISKPNFPSRKAFSENLVIIELRKLEMKFDKPIYMSMCIFHISKTCLYEYMAPEFREKYKIMYIDTDII